VVLFHQVGSIMEVKSRQEAGRDLMGRAAGSPPEHPSRRSLGLRGVRGGNRIAILRLHRLLLFEETFTAYIEHRDTAAHVAYRAKLMLEIGLPRLR
jgi:hypothetical protein